MWSYCAYQGCTAKNLPCSNTTFFNLPKDNRRAIWIENSGNPSLKNISPNAVKCFCDKHFDPIYLKRQFTRTILHRTAVPFKYNGVETAETSKHRKITVFKIKEDETGLDFEEDACNKSQSPSELTVQVLNSKETLDDLERQQQADEHSTELEHEQEQQETHSLDEEYSNVEYVLGFTEEPSEKDADFCEYQSTEQDDKYPENDDEECNEQLEIFIEKSTNGTNLDRTHRNYSKSQSNKRKQNISSSKLDYSKKRCISPVKSDYGKKINSNPTKSDYGKKINSNPTKLDHINHHEQDNDCSNHASSASSNKSDYSEEKMNCVSSSNLDYEEDKHFALSLVGSFQRLPKKKKAMAKLKILQYLTSMEYDDSSDL